MNIQAKKIELLNEFREFSRLSDTEKEAFKQKIEKEANQRSEAEKAEYRAAILSNVLEIKEKVLEIKAKLNSNIEVEMAV